MNETAYYYKSISCQLLIKIKILTRTLLILFIDNILNYLLINGRPLETDWLIVPLRLRSKYDLNVTWLWFEYKLDTDYTVIPIIHWPNDSTDMPTILTCL